MTDNLHRKDSQGFSESRQAHYAAMRDELMRMPPRRECVRLGEGGRFVIQSFMREEMGVKPCETLICHVADGELRVPSYEDNLRRIQEKFSKLKSRMRASWTNSWPSGAVLAFIFGEPGGSDVRQRFREALISSVNVTETVSGMVDHGANFEEALEDFHPLSLTIIDFDAEPSHIAARLRQATRHRGLSLGDCACLALAIREGATALTADRKWADLDVGCRIELIR